MKSLQNFKQVIEEEKSDYAKLDILVRAGLANKAQLHRIHRIMDKMGQEKPIFNNADREIMRNLFNRMSDLITNNRQIFLKARQAVREDVDEEQEVVDEGIIDSSTYKIGPSGRKVRAHRIKVGDVKYGEEDDIKEDFEIIDEKVDFDKDPPFVLVLKRKAIRLYPNKTKVALYYNQKLNKYFTIPYGSSVAAASIQAEETEYMEESVMDKLHSIVQNKSAQTVKFANGQTRKIDHYTASAITQVHKAVNDDNKKKLSDMVHKSPEHFERVATFAFSKAKK
jgi:hypothetical protein